MSRISAIGKNEVSEYVQEIFAEIENDIGKSDFTEAGCLGYFNV